MKQAAVQKTKDGDFDVTVDGVTVKGGYFSRYEDWAATEAREFCMKYNAELASNNNGVKQNE